MADDNVILLPNARPALPRWLVITIDPTPETAEIEVNAWSAEAFGDGSVKMFCGSTLEHAVAYDLALAMAQILGVKDIIDCTTTTIADSGAS